MKKMLRYQAHARKGVGYVPNCEIGLAFKENLNYFDRVLLNTKKIIEIQTVLYKRNRYRRRERENGIKRSFHQQPFSIEQMTQRQNTILCKKNFNRQK